MSEAQQLKKLFEDTKREMEQLKPWQRTNRIPMTRALRTRTGGTMKKSVKEQLEKHSVTPYPHKGWQAEFVVPVSVAMRIIRRACKEAYDRAAYDRIYGEGVLDRKKAVEDIINGPKKARKK